MVESLDGTQSFDQGVRMASTDTWLVFADTDHTYRISAGRKVEVVKPQPGWALTTLLRIGDVIRGLENQPKDREFTIIGILSDGALKFWKQADK
jgi:hypothetical protein